MMTALLREVLRGGAKGSNVNVNGPYFSRIAELGLLKRHGKNNKELVDNVNGNLSLLFSF